MASSKSIPSVLNAATTIEAVDETYLYITAVLAETSLNVDDAGGVTLGPISLESPIRCKKFIAGANGVVAYFVKSY